MLTRTDRRRFPILLAVIAALAMAMLLSPVQAQEGSAPDKPRGLETTATHDSVTLTWEDPQDDSITGYVILRRIPGVDPQGHFNELVSNTGTDATTYTDDTVSAETRYTYRIKAINEHGVSERSRWSHIDVPAAPEPEEEQAAEPPDQPRGLEATATHDSVTLTWDDPGDDSITGYVVLRRIPAVDPQGQFSELVSNTGTDATTYTDDTVSAETRYTYRIKAINEHGVSERSRWSHIDVPAAPEPEEEQAAEPPDQPRGLEATATHDSVTLTWDDPGDDSITGYVVLRRIPAVDPQGQFSELVSNTGTDATTYTDDTVSAETRYTYRIKAINEHGVSERSRWSHIDVPAAPEAAEGDDPDGEGDGGGAPGGPGKKANVSEPSGDDFPGSTSTTGEVDVGGSVTGNIDSGTDKDWFKVDLEMGKRYQIDLEGEDTGRGTLGNTFLTLYDASGNSLMVNDGSSGVGLNARLIFAPTANGTYYVQAADPGVDSAFGGATGTYTLSVIVLGANGASEADTDFPTTTSTTGRVEVGASVTGRSHPAGDYDWFSVDLEAGKTYQIDLEGVPTGRGTIEDPFLRLLDGTGNEQLAMDDDGGTDVNSKIVYTATATGAHYLEARSAIPGGGTYTLSVREVETEEPPCTLNEGDIWCGVVDVEEVRSTADVLTGHGFVGITGRETGGLAGHPDDTMFSVGDNDYTIQGIYVGSAANNEGALFFLLNADLSDDDEGILVLAFDGVTTLRPLDDATKLSTGLYNWSTDLDWSSTTEVTVRLQTPSDDADDPPAALPTLSIVNKSADEGETMLFVLSLSEATSENVTVTCTATFGGGDTAVAGDLTFTTASGRVRSGQMVGSCLFRSVQDTIVEDNETFTVTLSGVSSNAQLATDPTAKGTILDDDDPPVDDSETEEDDLAADTSTTGTVEVGGAAVRSIIRAPVFVEGTGGDVDGWDFDTDWFAVGLEADRTYRIDMKGALLSTDTDLTLRLPEITAIYDSDGNFLVNTWYSDESDSHYLFRVTFNASTDGIYFIAASGESFEWGTYKLWVKDITEDDHGDHGDEGDGTNGGKGLKNLRAVEEKGGVRLTWQSPDGAAVTGYRIERRRAGGQGSGPQRSHGQPRDHHTLVEDTGNTETSYVDESAEQGVEYEYQVSAHNESGPGEESDWVRAGPEEEPVLGDALPGAPRNLTATPGNREVTLSWDPPDDNGNPPATRYRIEWRVDGKDYDRNDWGTSQETTYTTNAQANLANGVKYFFRVKAENGSGYSYGPYGPASGEVSATPTSGSAVDLGTPVLSNTENLHHGMVQLDWQDIEDAGWYVVQYYHVEDEEWLDLPAAGVDIAFHGSSAVVSNLHGLSWLRVGAASCDGASEWSQIEELYGTNASDWEGVPVPDVEEGDEIEPCPVVLGTPVLSDTEILHHGMVQLDWQDIEDAGWYVVQYYHLEDGEWLDLPAEGVDIAFHGSSAVVSNLHGLSWLRVGAASCDGASEWSQIEESYGTNASDWKGVPVPEVAEGDEIEPCSEDADTPDNSPATGAPTIGGTAQVGQTLTSNTSGIADADGLSNVQYEYQWLADDDEIAGATNATYTLTDSEESKAITVRVSFTDDADNGEALTSAATDAVAAANIPATGAPTISGTARVGEVLTVDTSGISDEDGMENASFTFTWGASGYFRATGAVTEYTIQPDDEGKTVDVTAFFIDDKGNWEFVDSAPTSVVEARPNSPATGAPTISGTVRVGETLTADTSGIADADGLSNVQYEYQWLADDTDIAGATNATYTLTDSEESKAITVRVSFTDDADNEETLTSAATDMVAGAQPTEPPAKPTGLDATATHDSVTLTWDDPDDDSITGYVILRRVPGVDPEGHFDVLVADTATAATSYTDDTVSAETRYTYRIKAINGAGTSERSRWSHIDTPAAPVPDKPTGLEATESDGQVVLTWDDPGDDSITGYVILRRVRENNTGGDFSVLVADTASAAATYTDDTVAAGTTYTYRIKAINEHGTSERSRWYHIDIPEAP